MTVIIRKIVLIKHTGYACVLVGKLWGNFPKVSMSDRINAWGNSIEMLILQALESVPFRVFEGESP